MPGPRTARCTHSARPQIDRRGLGLLEVAQFHRGLVEAVSEGDISQFRVELRRHYLWGFPSQDGLASSPPDRAGGM